MFTLSTIVAMVALQWTPYRVSTADVLQAFRQPVLLVLIGALGQGLMLPFLGGVAVYFHHRRLAATFDTGVMWTVCLWLSALAMLLVGAYQLLQTFS